MTDNHSRKLERLAEALQKLYAFRPVSQVELQKWYLRARELEACLVAKNGLSPEVPSFLWHFLADADIRFKDKEYADTQNLKMRLVIQCLKRGELLSDEEILKYANTDNN